MKKQLFIFIEQQAVSKSVKHYQRKFSGVCAGNILRKIDLIFKNGPCDLAIGYYIFKIDIIKIESKTLFGEVLSYKYFGE
ncbi:hypothetical protein ABMA70_10075 [Halobacteriovorax sp. XZX-3]|uniref:hypothetical protein n=1 Tax=unclassified Halobacteriovorax TaxID=2639665 RepID=UPI000CD0D185|nr:hypothetical protein [Halobacteriovorax sp. DA5]POB13065.1 hypothetical protein C0Z22_11130 [Halobacteriovorax sp. DA5]